MRQDNLKIYNPYDRSQIGELPLVGLDEVEKALAKASQLASDPDKRLPIPERKEILRRTISIMQERRKEFITDSVSEGGKPWTDTEVEFERALQGIEVAIETIPRLVGEEIPMGLTVSSAQRMAFTFREPAGVCVALSAFNHPINLIVHQVVPAVAVGCPVIIKPASSTPLSCLNVVQALYDAGLPEQWCQAIICGHSAAEKLVADSRVAYFSFIGSGDVGWRLRSMLAPGVRCALEHGGVAPVIVEADADLDDMLPLLAKGGFYHAGQVCVSVQRLYVHQSICNAVAERLAGIAKGLTVGDPLDSVTEVGPLIEISEVERVSTWVDQAKQQGATVLCGGQRIGETCYAPTVLLNPPDDALVSTKEVFGPVVCVYPYTDRLEAIGRANNLPYSFQAAIFTKDIDAALDSVKRLKAKAVMVNDHTAFRVDWMPFGGTQQSGAGTGGIPYTMLEMTEEKLMVFRSPLL